MNKLRKQLLTVSTLFVTLGAPSAWAGSIDQTAPGPGVFALLALGVVGAIGIARLRK